MNLAVYPKECRKNIRRIVSAVGTNDEMAYAMMLMTAALMDLRPEDDSTAEIVLQDCGVYPEQAS